MSKAATASPAKALLDPKAEAWRFTPVEPLAGPAFETAGRPERVTPLAGKVLCPVGLHRVALVNGRREPKHDLLSLPKGVSVETLEEAAWAATDGAALSPLSAGAPGVLIRVARHARVEQPFHVVHLSEPDGSGRPQASFARVLVVLEAGASAELVEESWSDSPTPSWTDSRTRVVLEEGASLKHYRVVREGGQGRRTALVEAKLASRARYESHAFNLGGVLAREDLRAVLEGEGAECLLNGLVLLSGSDVADHHTVVTHATVGGTTNQLYKAVLDHKSRLVFDGLIDVRPGAQKTDAKVYNKNLLLSEDAKVNTNPEFKILADDVSCKHGGAIGQMSADSLFYLRSRGVGAEEARRLLIYAFGSEMVERIALEPLRAALTAALHARSPESLEAL
jgi:Fe-S cluster assembly protein SufD